MKVLITFFLLFSFILKSQSLNLEIIPVNELLYNTSNRFIIKNEMKLNFNSEKRIIFPILLNSSDYIENLVNEKSLNIEEIEEYLGNNLPISLSLLFDENNMVCKTDYTLPKTFTEKERLRLLFLEREITPIHFNLELPKITFKDYSSITFLFDKNKKYYFQMVYFIPNDFYEKNYSKEQISKWEKEGYELFTGTLKSNKVRIYNIEELICK